MDKFELSKKQYEAIVKAFDAVDVKPYTDEEGEQFYEFELYRSHQDNKSLMIHEFECFIEEGPHDKNPLSVEDTIKLGRALGGF